MTEPEWLRSRVARHMIRTVRARGTDRLWRLYVVACLRAVADLLVKPASRHAVEVAERYADGQASVEELAGAEAQARLAALEAHREEWEDEVRSNFRWTAASASFHESTLAAEGAQLCVTETVDIDRFYQGFLQADLLREIFGNPFRWKVIDPAWLTWNDGVVSNLAQTIYDEQAFDRLPILADALEDAGCADADMLEHLRSPGPHVRGCWVLDLILGKE